MPLYAYECGWCSSYHELAHGMLQQPKRRCPSCGKSKLRRIFSGQAIYADKDKRYEFTTQHLKPGTEIRTKGQWRRFLKANKMTDDLTAKELRDLAGSDSLKEKRSRERWQEVKRQIEPIIAKAAHEATRR